MSPFLESPCRNSPLKCSVGGVKGYAITFSKDDTGNLFAAYIWKRPIISVNWLDSLFNPPVWPVIVALISLMALEASFTIPMEVEISAEAFVWAIYSATSVEACEIIRQFAPQKKGSTTSRSQKISLLQSKILI